MYVTFVEQHNYRYGEQLSEGRPQEGEGMWLERGRTRESCSDGGVKYLDCGGGYTKTQGTKLQLHTHTI